MSIVYNLSVLISKNFKFYLFTTLINLSLCGYGQNKYSNKKTYLYFDNGINLCKEIKVRSKTGELVFNIYYVNFTDKNGTYVCLINNADNPVKNFMVSKKKFMKENYKSIYFKRHLINLNFKETINKFLFKNELFVIDLEKSTKDSLNIKKVYLASTLNLEM